MPEIPLQWPYRVSVGNVAASLASMEDTAQWMRCAGRLTGILWSGADFGSILPVLETRRQQERVPICVSDACRKTDSRQWPLCHLRRLIVHPPPRPLDTPSIFSTATLEESQPVNIKGTIITINAMGTHHAASPMGRISASVCGFNPCIAMPTRGRGQLGNLEYSSAQLGHLPAVGTLLAETV